MKEHKHWFQFVQKWDEYQLKINPKGRTGKEYVEFICLCGEQRIVEIKKAEKPEEK